MPAMTLTKGEQDEKADDGVFCVSSRKGIVGITPPDQWRDPWAFRPVLG
jgi:hypothetical protein